MMGSAAVPAPPPPPSGPWVTLRRGRRISPAPPSPLVLPCLPVAPSPSSAAAVGAATAPVPLQAGDNLPRLQVVGVVQVGPAGENEPVLPEFAPHLVRNAVVGDRRPVQGGGTVEAAGKGAAEVVDPGLIVG